MNASWPDSGYDLPQTVNCQITASLFLGFDKKAEEFISSLILSLFVSFPVSELGVTVLNEISGFFRSAIKAMRSALLKRRCGVFIRSEDYIFTQSM